MRSGIKVTHALSRTDDGLYVRFSTSSVRDQLGLFIHVRPVSSRWFQLLRCWRRAGRT